MTTKETTESRENSENLTPLQYEFSRCAQEYNPPLMSKTRQLLLFQSYGPNIVEELNQFFTSKNAHLPPFAAEENYKPENVLSLVLCPKKWLSDQDIDVYFKLIESSSNGNVMCYLCSYYMTKHNSAKPLNFNNNALKKSLSFGKSLLVPYNYCGNHWAMLWVDFPNKTVWHCDSIYSIVNENDKVLIIKYVVCILEHLFSKQLMHKESLNFGEWNVYAFTKPVQTNVFDCGVFVCAFAKNILRRHWVPLKQQDIPLLRQRMAYEIITGKLVP